MPSGHGQKVTTDPESTRNPINEGTGVVTSDSLAAESVKHDGDFGKDNPKAGVSKQPSASTNTNTTDTSNATKLGPAADAQARDASDKTSISTKGLGKESGVGPTYNATGSNKNSAGDTRGVSTGTSVGSDGVQGNIAPTAAYAGQDLEEGVYKPHGKNVKEDPNLEGKTKFGEIGTDDDPSRVAELKFAKTDAAVSGGGGKDLSQGGDSKFSGLKDQEA